MGGIEGGGGGAWRRGGVGSWLPLPIRDQCRAAVPTQHPRGLRGRRQARRTSAAASHRGAHVPAEGLGSSSQSLALARVPGGSHSPPGPPLRQPGAWVCGADKNRVCGSRGRPLGGAKPAGARSLGHVPPCSAPGRSASRDWYSPALRAEHHRVSCALCSPSGARDCFCCPDPLRPRGTPR